MRHFLVRLAPGPLGPLGRCTEGPLLPYATKLNNGTKHDNIVGGTIQVEKFEENWQRRKDALFISETKNINEDKNVVHMSKKTQYVAVMKNIVQTIVTVVIQKVVLKKKQKKTAITKFLSLII